MHLTSTARSRLFLALASLLVVAACDNGTEPRVPARLELVSGDGQTAQVGTVVAPPPTVRVVDRKGKPVSKVSVTFAVTSGGGSITTATVMSDAKGIAQAIGWTLGTVAGPNTLTASTAAIASASVVFTATGGAGAAFGLRVSTQPSALARSRVPLPEQPAVQVVDQYNNPVPAAGMSVTAQTSGVTLVGATATTDAAGLAQFSSLTMQGSVGVYRLRFSAGPLTPVDASTSTVLSAGTATKLALAAGFPANVVSGNTITPTPVVEVHDVDENIVTTGAFSVVVALAAGSGMLNGASPVISTAGRAQFGSLSYTGTGSFRLRFSSTGLTDVVSNDLIAQSSTVCAAPMTLNMSIGQMARFTADQPSAPQCLSFDLAQNRDQQFLVLFESDPGLGDYSAALFPGSGLPSNSISVGVTMGTGTPTLAARRVLAAEQQLPPGMSDAWDFGAGPIYEYQPPPPPAGTAEPRLLRRGQTMSLSNAQADPKIGDTITVYLEGIPRLNITSGTQRAVIRDISNELIFAEDTRLGVLLRQSGQINTPLTTALMDSIAQAYAAQSKLQADMLFNGRYNSTTEAQTLHRIIAVHTLMPADNIWGYTYSTTNAFAWDYWVGTNGSTRGLNQHVLRNAHNLFMHEIAHTRHWGLIERSGHSQWGNLWLVEGFARFSERLPIASYLLNNSDPSRTGNVVLPFYSEFAPSYFRDDVPTFLNAGSSFLGGYQQSSYIFDYFADQVASAAGNWRAALAAFISVADREIDLDALINSALPGLNFRSLITRARVALYTDDIGTTSLPLWTQYLQYQLRASRPPGTSGAGVDPRTVWPKIVPGTSYSDARLIFPGAAFGYVIDGTAATANARIVLGFPNNNEAVVSITRIK